MALDFLLGSPAQEKQFQRFNPAQQNILGQLDQILQQGLSGLQSNKFDLAPIEQQARTDFATKTIPGIAERFTAMGGDTRGSSAFAGALGAAGSGLDQSLASLRSNVGMQQQNQQQQLLMNLLGQALQPRFETGYSPESPGLIKSGLTAFAGGLGNALGGGGIGETLQLLKTLLSLGSGSPTQQSQQQNVVESAQARQSFIPQPNYLYNYQR